MAAINTTLVSSFINATTPTAAAEKPGTFTGPSSGGAMRINLTSSSNATGTGTELSATGYTTHGIAFTAVTATSSAGSSVTLPAAGDASTFLWTAGATWTVYGLNIIDFADAQCWFGNFNGSPITVTSGNSFQIASLAITIALT